MRLCLERRLESDGWGVRLLTTANDVGILPLHYDRAPGALLHARAAAARDRAHQAAEPKAADGGRPRDFKCWSRERYLSMIVVDTCMRVETPLTSCLNV